MGHSHQINKKLRIGAKLKLLFGVATIMAVMEDKTLKHGPIEGLITADEETGLFGANGLPEGELNGDILLNLDSEHWGKFVIGSAARHRIDNL